MGTGVESVDEEHRQLIGKLNELYRAHQAGASVDDISKMLRFLGRYAETHFRHEEEIMEHRKCPLWRENRSAHARFLREYQELASAFSIEDDTDQMATDIENMVARWLSTHICKIDVALRDSPPPDTK